MLKKNIKRYKIMEQHMVYTRQGMYYEAKTLLRLIQKGWVVLGLSDADNNVEIFLEKIECPVTYGRNFLSAKFRL